MINVRLNEMAGLVFFVVRSRHFDFLYHRGSYRGTLKMRDKLILFFVKCEFTKLFATRDLKVSCDLGRTSIIN